MAVKEHIHIHEKVTVFIKDNNGKVTSRTIKTPWHEKSLLDKFLTVIGLKKEPGTLTANGRAALAKLYGGNTGGLYTAISYVASGTPPDPAINIVYKIATRVWADPVLTFSNEGDPFTAANTYTWVYLSDTTYLLYHSIGLGPAGVSTVQIGAGYSWWAEVKLTFSGS